LTYKWTKDKQNAASPPKRYLEIREGYIMHELLIKLKLERDQQNQRIDICSDKTENGHQIAL
jgi:CRISPR/Cas system-associated protein endoribonuclease Cas2